MFACLVITGPPAVGVTGNQPFERIVLRDYIELPLQVRILCLGALINRAGSFVLIYMTIYASETLGFGIAFATACMGVFGFGSMIGSFLGGQLADQWGRRLVMLLALFGGALILLVMGTVENRWAFMASVWLFAVVSDLYRPAASAMIADRVEPARRPHAFALMYISINLGFAIAPPLGGFLASYSFTWLFVGDALTMALFGLVIVFAIGESRPAKTSPEEGGKEIPMMTALRSIAGDTPFLLFCISTLLIELVFMQGLTTLPICIRQSGLSHAEFGILMSVNGIMIFLVQLPMTHWLARFSPMSVIIVGGVLISIGFGLNAFAEDVGHRVFALFACTIAIWTSGEILQSPFKMAVVSDIAPIELRARYQGVFGVAFALALTVGAPTGGLILSQYGSRTLWSTAFCIATFAIVVYIAIRRSIEKRISEMRDVT